MKAPVNKKVSKDDTARLTKRLAALAARVKKLEKRNSDLVLKSQIASHQLFRSPLEEFFASPEFWENTYDSGEADCSKRCIDNLQASYRACDSRHPEGSPEWNACRAEALDRAANCHRNCSGAFPPPTG
jgi:hypothetical protein